MIKIHAFKKRNRFVALRHHALNATSMYIPTPE